MINSLVKLSKLKGGLVNGLSSEYVIVYSMILAHSGSLRVISFKGIII